MRTIPQDRHNDRPACRGCMWNPNVEKACCPVISCHKGFEPEDTKATMKCWGPESQYGLSLGEYVGADLLTTRVTAFESFAALINSATNYVPSLRRDAPAAMRLADLYDRAQENRGDSRRAYRS